MQMVHSLGIIIFQALDYGLSETEEQKLSPLLESLIERMTGSNGGEQNIEREADGDEGIEDDNEDKDSRHLNLLDVIQVWFYVFVSCNSDPHVMEKYRWSHRHDNCGLLFSSLICVVYDLQNKISNWILFFPNLLSWLPIVQSCVARFSRFSRMLLTLSCKQ